MSAADEALATLKGIKSLMLEGKTLHGDVAEILTGATVERTIDGAPTLTLTLHDDKRKLLRSGILSNRVTAQLDAFSFELVQVRKSGPQLTVVFEDLAVAALRRHDTPTKVAANTTTHVEFARRLVSEESWITFRPPQKLAAEKNKVELARGQPAAEDQAEEREDTWTAIGRLADERGWRRFMREGQLWYMPETYLLERPVMYVVKENVRGGVDHVDFDFDIGKPVAEATISARAGRWQVPIGAVVELQELGPANGKWLVSSISRSLFDLTTTITVTKARPTLPEPEPPPAPTAEELGPEGEPHVVSGDEGRHTTGGVSERGYVWPLRGRITSGFGQRNGRLHAGIDIAASVGTPVHATRGGTVTFAGSAGGYGYVVYIDHGDVISRYAHLSRIDARRGQRVAQGDHVGLSGGARGAVGAGNSSGPHLHFEIRPGNSPADPMRYLP